LSAPLAFFMAAVYSRKNRFDKSGKSQVNIYFDYYLLAPSFILSLPALDFRKTI
jgi:hypothetical protein